MFIKVCLNGRRSPGSHPRLPVSPEQLASDAQACVGFGAGAAHLHPRREDGRESLAARDVAAAVRAVRRACPGLPVGVSTGAWIMPDPEQRVAEVRSWAGLDESAKPDFASVSLGEPAWEQVAEALLDGGIGVEAGISRPDEPATLAASGLAPRCVRLLVEPEPPDPDAAIRTADGLLAMLHMLAPDVPRLVHGQDATAWPILEWALNQGLDTRIGLEDCLELPDGSTAPDNPALLAAAYAYLMEPH